MSKSALAAAPAQSGPFEIAWTQGHFQLFPVMARVRNSKMDAGRECLAYVQPVLERFGVTSIKVFEDNNAPFTAVEFQFVWNGAKNHCVAGAWDLRELVQDMVRMAAEAVNEKPSAVEKTVFHEMSLSSVQQILEFLQNEGIHFQGNRKGKRLDLQPILEF